MITPLVLLLLLATATPAGAQFLGDRKEVHCGNLAEGDLIDSTVHIVCGMRPAEFAENMRLALSPLAADKQELFRRLDALMPQGTALRVEAVAAFFGILREAEVPADRLRDRFAQIATEHLQLKEEIRRFRVADPEVQALRDDASAALDRGDHDAARAALVQARDLVRAKREAVAKVLADQQREEATLVREQAKVEAARLRFADAARLHEEAAGLLPEADLDQRWQDLIDAGARWRDHGRDFGDNSALVRAIAAFDRAMALKPRTAFGDDWAAGQVWRGNALMVLGQREGGTARLEEVVATYHAALKERTRARVPLDWAATQYNLGIALGALGEREGGTARLAEAVAAYRAALEEFTHARAPLQWAYSQHNLAHALEALADRRGDPEELKEAVACMRRAAEIYREGGVGYYWLPVAEESIARMEEKLAQRTATAADPGDARP